MHRPWPKRLSGSFLVLIAGLLSLAVLVNAAAALSAQPSLTVTSPASGSIVSAWDPPITVSASDGSALNATATLILDGTSRALSVAFNEVGGHWEGDGCDTWWVPDYDYTKATASFVPSMLADGSHDATVTWGDSAGNSNSVAWSFRIAAPPKAGGFVPADGAAVKGPSPTVSAVISDNGAIATASVSVDGSHIPATYDPATKTISGSPATPLSDGVHSASVRATDAGGLVSTSIWSFSTATTSTIGFRNASPSDGTTVTAWNPTISVGCTDTAVLSSMSMQLDGAVVPGTLQLAPGAHAATLTCPTTSLSDGRHAVSVSATNSLGFSSTYRWSFGIAAPPRLSAPSPATGAFVATLTPQLSVKVAENGDMGSWAMQVDGTPVGAAYDAALKTIAGVPARLTDEATHVVSVQATDAAGAGASYSWSFRTHASPPVLSGPSPADGSAVQLSAPAIGVNASDVMGLAGTATMKVDGTAVPCSVSYVVSGGHWEDDGCSSWWVTDYDYTHATISCSPSALANGPHTVAVTEANGGGNTATYTWSFTISAPPKLSSPIPADGSWTTTREPVVSTHVVASSAIVSATVMIDGIPASTVYDAVNNVVKGTPLGLLSDDVTHVATATVQDAEGLIGTLSWTFGVHSTGPHLTGQTPVDGSVVSVPDANIALSAWDAAGLPGGPTVKLDGAAVPATWSWLVTGWEWCDDGCDVWYEPVYDTTNANVTYAARNLKDGTHTVDVQWTSATGLRTNSSWAFKVASPPALSSPSPANGGWAATLTSPVSVQASDNGTITAAMISIDGVAAPTTYSAVTKTITALPAWPLTPGTTHAVVAVATDDSGYTSSYAWSFQTQNVAYVGPAVWAQTPSNSSTVTVASPRISINASDAAGMASTAVMTLDGSIVPCTWSYLETGGKWVGTGCDMYWDPTYDYTRGTAWFQTSGLSEGVHNVTATLRNSAGNATTSSWSFMVAVPPSLSALSPAPGSAVATLVPTISFKVADNGVVATTSVSVDGAPIPCQYDPFAKTVTALPVVPLSDNTAHAVVATVTDGVGAVGTARWSFNVRTGPPVVESATPETSTVVWNPLISLSAYDSSGFNPAGVAMKLDGATVPTSLAYKVISEEWVDDGCGGYLQQTFDYTRATVSYQPYNLADGPHTVWVQLTNNAGTSMTRTWQVEVKSPPRLSDGQPIAGSSVATQTPAISLAVAENSAVGTVSATIDGTSVPAAYDGASKRVNVLPTAPLANDVDHTVAVTVTDAAGNSARMAWSFHVQIYLPMDNTLNCADCHQSVGHTTTNCVPCHGGDCGGSGCHGSGHGILYFQPSECSGCHATNGIGHPDITGIHTTSRDMTDCRACHVSSLTTEHSRYRDKAGNPFTCNTCHQSADQRVTAAIAAGTSDCAGCHDISGAGHVSQHGDVQLAADCLQCHQANLVDEHLSNAKTQKTALTCDTCHASTDPKVASAVRSGGADCSTCHETSHGDLGVVHAATDIGSQGCAAAGCHGTDDALALHASRPEGPCAVCHANPSRGDLTVGKASTACGGCHSTSGVDYHKNMVVHYAPDSYGTCGHCHHGWGGSPIQGPDVTRHAGGCSTCHNATMNLGGLTTKCSNCHKQEGTDFHTDTALYHTATDAGSLGCARCHASTNVQEVHKDVGCDVCHATYVCGECHATHSGGSGGALLAGVSCSRCHATQGTDYHRNFDVEHTFTGMDASCQASGCHSNTLVDVHQAFVGPGNKYPQYVDTCALCHLNDDPSRIPPNATADCSSCHGDMSGGHQSIHDTAAATETVPGGTAKCGDCHASNLITEHAKAGASSAQAGCAACHPSPRNTLAAWNPSGCVQGSCHSVDSSAPMHATIGAAHAIGGDSTMCVGSGCHSGDLSSIHLNASTVTGGKTVTGCLVCHDASHVPSSGACTACHDKNLHAATHVSSNLPASVQIFVGGHEGSPASSINAPCSMCHEVSDISALHGGRCSTCHPGPRDTFTTWTGGCQQGGCHPVIHGNADAGHRSVTARGMSNGGCACHDPGTWGVDASTCGTCHRLVDHIAPTTAADALTAYVGPAIIHLTPSDLPSPGGSGVAHTFCVLDGVPSTGTIVIVPQPSSGTVSHVLQFWSDDGAGNVEATHTARFTVAADTAPPRTVSDVRSTYYGTANITLTATDNGTAKPTTYYVLDAAAPATGTVLSVPQPSSGTVTHTLKFWSVDGAGNVESTHTATFTSSIDSVPPVTTSNAKAFYRAVSAETIVLSATDAGSGVAATYYRLDGGSVVAGTLVGISSVTPAGGHVLEYWSVDNAGNTETHKTVAFSIDRTPPTTTSDALATYSSAATIHLSARDDAGGSGVATTYYKLDGGQAAAGSTVSVSTGGQHVLEFWSVDAVGNAETHKSASFTVALADSTPPSSSSNVLGSYSGTAIISILATDGPSGSGVKATYHVVDGGSPGTDTTFAVYLPGSHTLEFWSVDNAGNVETPHKTATFVVSQPNGMGTISFLWSQPPAGSWSNYYVYDSSGVLLTSANNTTGNYTVSVPVSSKPYDVRVYWYDPWDPGYPVWSYGSALVDSSGKIVQWYY